MLQEQLAEFVFGAIGDDRNGPDAGSVTVLSGRDGSVLLNFLGDGAGSLLGSAIAGLGDTNGDGRGDFVIGAPRAYANGIRSGVNSTHCNFG